MRKGKIIFQQQSGDDLITVFDSGRLRWLTFDNNFIQTRIDKKKPWRPELCYLEPLCVTTSYHVENILILGLGGGALVHYLQQYAPHAQIKAVEINKDVIHIAETYFDINIPVIHDCALNYLNTAPCHSHIYIDVFTQSANSNLEFMMDLLKKCHQAESVSLNLLFNDRDECFEFITLFRDIFQQKTLCLITKGRSNIVLHAFLSGDYMENLIHLHKRRVIKKPVWDQVMGAVSELY